MANRKPIAQEVIELLDQATQAGKPASLQELRGLGKEVWERELAGKDAAEYIAGERDAWR